MASSSLGPACPPLARRLGRQGAAALVLFLAGTSARGQSPAPDSAVRLVTLAGERDARLVGWDETGPRVSAPSGVAVTASQWLEIRPVAPGQSPVPRAWRLELAGGGWLRGAPGGGEGDLFHWRLPGGPELRMDLLWLRGLARDRLPPSPGAEGPDRLWLDLEGALDERRGWLLGAAEDGLRFEDAGGEATFGWERVVGLALTEEPLEEPAAEAWLVLAGELGAVRVRVRGLAAGTLTVEPPWGGRWTLPLGRIAALYRLAAPAQDLTRRLPDVAEGPAGKVLDWSPRAGRSVEGHPLRVAGRVHPGGWGTRAPARLRFSAVGPGILRVRVGVDDEVRAARHRQPVRFRILFDGQEVARTPPLEVGEGPRTLVARLPEPGVLELLSESHPSVGAHGDWLEPLLLPADWPASP